MDEVEEVVEETGDDPTLVAPKPEGGDPPIPGIDRNVLPEDLRNLPEAEIKFHLNQMVSGFRNQHSQVETLKQELDRLSSEVAKAPKEPPKPIRPLEEEILDDPESAIMRVLENKGYIQRFNRIEEDAGESSYALVASKIPGFDEYEKDVREIIKASGVPKTVAHIMGALEMAVGRRTLTEKTRETRKAHSPSVPKEDLSVKKSKLPELIGLEKEIFESSGMSREEWNKHKNSDFNIEVPTS